jgi:hypothetical protein
MDDGLRTYVKNLRYLMAEMTNQKKRQSRLFHSIT